MADVFQAYYEYSCSVPLCTHIQYGQCYLNDIATQPVSPKIKLKFGVAQADRK